MRPAVRNVFVQTLMGRLLLGLFLVAGTLAYQSMSREHAPDLEIPQALVKVEWPGAAPEQVEKEVTKPFTIKSTKAKQELKGKKASEGFHQLSKQLETFMTYEGLGLEPPQQGDGSELTELENYALQSVRESLVFDKGRYTVGLTFAPIDLHL